MARLYGRSPEGQRALGIRPYQKGNNVTIIGALSYQGIEAAMSIQGYMDGDCFLEYVRQVLVPKLKPENVVVTDNLSCHTVPGIREAIEATGSRLLFLPPYSPEFSPIELCWSKVKSLLRHFACRSYELLDQGITVALGCITPFDAVAWFKHCGYCIQNE